MAKDSHQSDGGKGGPLSASPLDMENHADRRTLAAGVTHGWGVKPEDLRYYWDALKKATEAAKADGSARDINSCVKTAAVIAGQVQAQEHFEDKCRRLDAGDATENVTQTTVWKVPPPRTLDSSTE